MGRAIFRRSSECVFLRSDARIPVCFMRIILINFCGAASCEREIRMKLRGIVITAVVANLPLDARARNWHQKLGLVAFAVPAAQDNCAETKYVGPLKHVWSFVHRSPLASPGSRIHRCGARTCRSVHERGYRGRRMLRSARHGSPQLARCPHPSVSSAEPKVLARSMRSAAGRKVSIQHCLCSPNRDCQGLLFEPVGDWVHRQRDGPVASGIRCRPSCQSGDVRRGRAFRRHAGL